MDLQISIFRYDFYYPNQVFDMRHSSKVDKSMPSEVANEQNPLQSSDEPTATVDANLVAILDTLAAVSAERDQAKDQAVRAMAELQNVRRRSQEQVDLVRKMATDHLVRQLLPVLDNFERSSAALQNGASVESVLEGISVIDRQLRAVLESVAVKRIESVGAEFDPEFHEAIGLESHPELPADTVSTEIEAGYTMAGKVLRPAKVRVSQGP
jgi:molecular chaperone GrpE